MASGVLQESASEENRLNFNGKLTWIEPLFMVPALFFDLDGTLVDSEELHWQAWRATLLPMKIDLSWERYSEECIGHPDPEILWRLIPDAQPRKAIKPDEVLRDKQGYFIAMVTMRPPFSVEMIHLLKELRHFPMAVVTSSPSAEVSALLDGGGVASFFQTLVCLEDVRNPKPDPEPYLLAMRRMGVVEGIAFEDSHSGSVSATAAGLEVIRISTPSDLPDAVRSRLTPLVSGTLSRSGIQ